MQRASARRREDRQRRWDVPAVPPLIALGLIVLGWEAAVPLLGLPNIVLPSPTEVATALFHNRATLLTNALATGLRVLVGFSVSVPVAVLLAVLVVWSPFVQRTVYPLITLSQTIPKVALAPLFVVWLGTGAVSQTTFAALIAFFPIFIDTLVGLRSTEPEMILLARSMGASEVQVFRKFRMPNAIPNLFAGLKVGATLSVIGAIVAEWVGGETGLALVLLRSDALFETSMAFAALVVLALMGIVFFSLILGLEILLLPWRTARERQEIAKTT